MKIKTIDIFCEVMDNYGDIGVAYRLAKELKRTLSKDVIIRLILNRLDEFICINKKVENVGYQIVEGIECLTYEYLNKNLYTLLTSNVIIECFGCNIPKDYMDKAFFESELLINLEYLSAEEWVQEFHLKESLLNRGKLKKVFFMPGFNENTGGLIIDNDFLVINEKVRKNREFYLKKYEVPLDSELIGTIFSYEKEFDNLIENLLKLNKEVTLIVMDEKSKNSFLKLFENFSFKCIQNVYIYDKIKVKLAPFYNQEEYEEVISLSDFNFVRGEDSFVRALLLGKPFLWQIYPQVDDVHLIKLEAFLEAYCPDDLELKKTFINYNRGTDDYSYFFQNLNKINKLNNLYKEFLIEKCNLINDLKKFIENF